MDTTPSPIQNLRNLLTSLKDQEGGIQEKRGGILMPIDESDSDAESELDMDDNSAAPSEIPPFQRFKPVPRPDVLAVDSGSISLGETETAWFFALRSAIYFEFAKSEGTATVRTGPVSLRRADLPAIFQQIGKGQGQEDFYTFQDSSGILRLKNGIADSPNHAIDKIRSHIENCLRHYAVTNCSEGSLVLLDGSTTIGHTRSVSDNFLRMIVESAQNHGATIIAVSKSSQLSICGKPIRWWLSDTSGSGYRPVWEMLEDERKNRILGKTYVVRLSDVENSPVFRCDVCPGAGQSFEEALGMLAAAKMKFGYPSSLVQAHIHSVIPSPNRLQMKARIAAKHGLVIQDDEKPLHAAFCPFGGAFK